MARSDSFDWYKREPKKFIRGVQGMGPDMIGAYALILDLIYEDEDSCPNDAAWLAGIMGKCNARKARALIDGLLRIGKLSLNPAGRLINEKARQVLDARATSRRHAADIGSTGGRRSAAKRIGSNKNNDLKTPPVNQLEKNRIEENRKKEEEKKKGSNTPAPKGQGESPKPKTRLPEEFPHAEAKLAAVNYWNKKGRADLAAAVEDQADQFRDHHLKEASRQADWAASWRTWVRNALEFTRAPRPSGRFGVVDGGAPAFEDANISGWIERLKVFDGAGDDGRKGRWVPKWGPEPAAVGCRVPDEAFQAYADLQRRARAARPA